MDSISFHPEQVKGMETSKGHSLVHLDPLSMISSACSWAEYQHLGAVVQRDLSAQVIGTPIL